MKFDLIRPCADCPFRSDKRFHLGASRAREIAESEGVFSCHKTLDYSRDSEGRKTDQTQACAGSILMQEHEGKPCQNLRIAERLGLYDASKMDMGAPVYKSRLSFVKANYKSAGMIRPTGAPARSPASTRARLSKAGA